MTLEQRAIYVSVKLVLSLIFSSAVTLLEAQSGRVYVSISVDAVRINFTGDGSTTDMRLRLWYNDDDPFNCMSVNNATPNEWHTVNRLFVENRPIQIDEDIKLGLTAWDEDSHYQCDNRNSCGQGNCEINTGCDCGDQRVMVHQVGAIVGGPYSNDSTFTLHEYQPGGFENIIRINYINKENRNEIWSVRYKVTYTVPTPAAPTITVGKLLITSRTGNICSDSAVTIASRTSIHENFNDLISYTWKYSIAHETRTTTELNPEHCDCDSPMPEFPEMRNPSPNSGLEKFLSVNLRAPEEPCCFEPRYISTTIINWRTIDESMFQTADNGTKYFHLRSLPGLENIAHNSSIVFVAIATVGTQSSAQSFPSVTVNLSPAAPDADLISTQSTCPNKINGSIQLNDIQGAAIRYVVKPGLNNTAQCDPGVNCFAGMHSGYISNQTNYNIQNIDHGDYTLWLANTGGTKGSCYSTHNITVERIPDLSLKISDLKNVACNGERTGNISLSNSGGAAPFQFTIDGIETNATGLFADLPVGTYHASISDACEQLAERSLDLKQPVKIIETGFNTENATCIIPGNGKIFLTVNRSAGLYDTLVSNSLQYRIFKDSILYRASESSVTSLNENSLPVGRNYMLVVAEKDSDDCNSYRKSFSIDPPPSLSIDNLRIKNVSCFNGFDGEIGFTGSGGSDSYEFKLTRTPGDTISNSSGNFAGLDGGDYALVIENALPGCLDKAIYPNLISLTQPTEIAINLNKIDISCFGLNDGTIASMVSGGTPSYSYFWEKYFNPNWNIIGTNEDVTDQSMGIYRLRIIDRNNCSRISRPLSILEPDRLEIASTTLNDIRCFGDAGAIAVNAIGGTAPYSYHYSMDNGETFIPFTSTTPLYAGGYKIEATDRNGCSFVDPGIYTITSPLEPFNFTFQQSNYNGFNISCLGGNNGYIRLNGIGGNGGEYSGYRFAINDGIFQSSNFINDINAGSHSITAIDGRGCLVSKNIIFTQISDALTAEIISKRDVMCYGDLTGQLIVEGSGGVTPYSFSINESIEQTSPVFTKLGVGSYTVNITDANGCTAGQNGNIINLNPKTLFKTIIENVNCFGGTDGSITVTDLQGASPFQFAWEGQSITSNILQNAGQGTYSITITDSNGCIRDSSVVISEPAQALELNVKTSLVCYGKTNGEITILAKGGTAPYQYSIDNGDHTQRDPIFNAVEPGSYAIRVIDSNSCAVNANALVVERSDKPEPNFLVSTRQNSLDTLIIKEISIPKPDSVEWLFDENAVIISSNPWEPQIKFNEPGTYNIRMIGFFSECDFEIVKTLAINPFDSSAGPSKATSYRTIQSVDVSPNPNKGEFEIKVSLLRKNNLSVTLYDLLGTKHYDSSWSEVENLEQQISLPNTASGIYVLRVITDTDAKDIRVNIN